MHFPAIDDEFRMQRLQPPAGGVEMVLDTDTYNEIDDQFAVTYALLSSPKLRVEAIYAAPFWNNRSSDAADGMRKSYEEVHRLLEQLDLSTHCPVFEGSEGFLSGPGIPRRSMAALDLIDRAMHRKEKPLYVAAIGAITNVASAILLEPEIIKRIVVVWLGGHAHYWDHTREFNLKQDMDASRLILDCGVPLMQIPCLPVASHLLTSLPELEACIRGKSSIGDYLFRIFEQYVEDHFGRAKEIWDISALAWLIEPEWVPSKVSRSPVLTDQCTWNRDGTRHLMRCAVFVQRNSIFRDLFGKIQAAGS
jgi:inosine-uridine nucleoside N-ribohydrolase